MRVEVDLLLCKSDRDRLGALKNASFLGKVPVGRAKLAARESHPFRIFVTDYQHIINKAHAHTLQNILKINLLLFLF